MEKRTKNLIRIFSIGVFIISWVILIYLKNSNPDLNLKLSFFITIIISIISIIAFFGENLQKKIKEEDKNTPKAIGEDEIKKIIEKQVDKMWNHLLIDNGIEQTKQKTVNKNIIVACKINLLYEEKYGESCWIIINTNYPERIPSILPPDTSINDIEKEMNYISQSPLDEPDIEEIETENSLTGTRQKVKKTIQQKKKEDKQEEIV